MLVHASCAARDGNGVVLTGPPGSGKSDLLLRLLDRGFQFVADDQVEILGDMASPPDALAGLLEIRGIGIMRVSHVAPVRLALSVVLGQAERLPRRTLGRWAIPTISIDPANVSAAQRVDIALACALGQINQEVGAFTPW